MLIIVVDVRNVTLMNTYVVTVTVIVVESLSAIQKDVTVRIADFWIVTQCLDAKTVKQFTLCHQLHYLLVPWTVVANIALMFV